MNTRPVTTPQAAEPCLSPVTIWQMLLSRLLGQHYGLTLDDTPFSDETVIKEHIDAGITLSDALNFLVESMNWFVSIVRGLAGKNSRHLLPLQIFSEPGERWEK